MDIRPQDSDYRGKRWAAHYQSVEQFLTKLPPLSVLTLFGWHSHISIDSLITTHGSRLRKLDLSCFLEAWQHVNEQDIFNLEGIGDRKEVAFYRALGTLRGLKYLNLELDAMSATFRRDKWTRASPEQRSAEGIKPPSDPSFDEFDNELTDLYLRDLQFRKGHIRDVMITSVVDKDLACAIFRIISTAKSHGMQGLEAIKISISWSMYMEYSLLELVELLGSSWIIRRDTREGHQGDLTAEEVRDSTPLHIRKKRQVPLCSELDEIFQRIWPGGEDRRSWWSECHSFPLDTSVDD
ncbi:uncharacterized protein N7496_004280 [Penicillium cataractarum]|uniref:Uncharacterized protein n=1 Tax=Penicillium cataractarum TaxID=2100454 RepID=A0A9W9VH85_9EURO|nr:uncharacterized protein N7496_004280 [Penicillium cataractarum]KAJ5381852.1 hypothetical protein N7496_004280 [Penicillium cataractarum]